MQEQPGKKAHPITADGLFCLGTNTDANGGIPTRAQRPAGWVGESEWAEQLAG